LSSREEGGRGERGSVVVVVVGGKEDEGVGSSGKAEGEEGEPVKRESSQ
jgi:hypothetical protein